MARSASRRGQLALLALALGCGRAAPLVAPPGEDAGTKVAAAPELRDAGEAFALDGGLGPPYPIVLAYGFGGSVGIAPGEYFYRVPEALRADGHQIFVAEVEPFNDSYQRGAELLAFVREVLRETGAARVDLIAHSQGGLDARFVAHELPGGVAALVTISTPHHGTAAADLALEGGGSAIEGELTALFAGSDGGTPVGLASAIAQLSTDGVAAFNAKIPDAPSVDCYSIAGRSNLLLARDACRSTAEPPFISRWDPFVDPMRPTFLATAALLTGDPFDPTPNDGLITVASAHWDTFLGCVPADHLDEIGQIKGESPGLGNPFDYLAFYRGLASWLVTQGY